MSSLADIPSDAQCRRIIRGLTGSNYCSQGHKVIWRAGRSYGWCSVCRQKVYPYGHSFLYGSKLSPRQLFCLLWHWQRRSSPGTVMASLGLEYPTIRRWYARFREQLPPDDTTRLTGVVEVDEAYFGRKRHGHQVIVMGAIERFPNPHTGKRRLKLQLIPDTEQDSLESFLEKYVERSCLVATDCHMGYNGIEWLGYTHERWNHSAGHFAGTNHIEQNWSAMKRYLRKLYGNIPTKHIQSILNEWVARHNQPELFESPEEYLGRVVLD